MDDQAAAYGLAQCLEHQGGDGQLKEADTLYRATMAKEPESDMAEQCREALSRLAARTYRATGGGAPRMDAVMYCLDALQRLRQMAPADIHKLAFEIAMLGRGGLDVNSPAQKYTLECMPGTFSGLQLVSLMYVALKQVAPEVDAGFDLHREYETALSLDQG